MHFAASPGSSCRCSCRIPKITGCLGIGRSQVKGTDISRRTKCPINPICMYYQRNWLLASSGSLGNKAKDAHWQTHHWCPKTIHNLILFSRACRPTFWIRATSWGLLGRPSRFDLLNLIVEDGRGANVLLAAGSALCCVLATTFHSSFSCG